jgi:hypothetical protein
MSDLLDLIIDTFPANNDVGVPLLSNITITLSGLDYDATSLQEGLFVEGPDTDQYVGPGLIEQVFPNNISQGELDDFLESPGYLGIVGGTVTVSGHFADAEVSYDHTVVTFDPILPMQALTEYIVNLTSVTTVSGVDYDGFVSFSFTTGSGSIEEVPASVSTSVLSAATPEAVAPSTADLQVVSTTPDDRSVENPTDLQEITVEFNKQLDPTSVANASITVKTIPATDHPNANVQTAGDLAKVVEVDGNKMKIKI